VERGEMFHRRNAPEKSWLIRMQHVGVIDSKNPALVEVETTVMLFCPLTKNSYGAI
jgi:hypothetical protein